MATERESLADYVRLLQRNRNFRLLWGAQIISELGDWFYSAALLTLLLELTGKAQSVALVIILQVLPQVLVSPMAGVINDRMSRRKVMIFADWARCAVVAAMLLVRSPDSVWLAYLLLFLETVLWAHFEPARTAVIPVITSGGDVLVANTLSSLTWSFNFTMGFALGGIAAAFLGRPAVFALNALSFAVSALILRRMRFEEGHLSRHPPLRLQDLADFSPVLEGVRYIRANPRMVATLLLKGGLGLSGTNWVILTIMGETVFAVRARGLSAEQGGLVGMSLLMGARGLGSLFGPIVARQLTGTSAARMRRGILIGFLLSSAGYLLLAVAPSMAAACACVALAHAGTAVIWVFSTTLMQELAEDRFRGRVFSAEFAMAMTAVSLTNAVAATLIDSGVSVFATAAGTGVVLLAPALYWARAQRLWR